ncbi:unnamed protein product [Urochloa humidicola]
MDVESCAAAAPVAVDWRGRPCRPQRHGGMRAAVFVLGIQGFEIMAIAAVGNNLITYVFGEMHFPLSQAANVVTNFVGTIFLLSLLGGFLSDSYLGCFWTMLTFGFVELSGFILLSLQAHLPQLKPPPCDMSSMGGSCEKAGGFKSTVFFLALYLVALGSGCLKPNMIAHGADQFDAAAPGGGRRLSTYFNSAYFSFCAGELVALTALVWVQTHSGMDVGFGISAAAMAAGLVSLVSGAALYRNKPPQGSIFTPIARVFVAAYSKRKQVCPSTSNSVNAGACEPSRLGNNNFRHNNKFRFLDKACIRVAQQGPNTKPESPWRLCTPLEVQQTKTLLAVTPIFACTIVFNTVLAQLQTFSVQQGSAMDTALPPGSDSAFHIPPASLQAIPYAMLLALVPAYELLLVPLMRRATGTRSGITPLQRIGVGLATVSFSMVAAASVERRRRDASGEGNQMSVLWIVPQFLVFGVSEMFTAVGLIEFFYKQACGGGSMQAFLTALTYCSYAFGFYLSSVLVSLVNRVTAGHASGGGGGWLGDNDLNKDRLDLFYWMLAALSVLNFFCFLLCARWYNAGVDGADDAAAASGGQVAAESADGKEII